MQLKVDETVQGFHIRFIKILYFSKMRNGFWRILSSDYQNLGFVLIFVKITASMSLTKISQTHFEKFFCILFSKFAHICNKYKEPQCNN